MQNNINVLDVSIPTKDKNKYSRKFWLMMSAFYMLFIIRNILHIEFPVVIYLGWVAIMALVFDDSEIKALVISFIPLSPGFQFKYAMFICIFVLIIKYYNRFRINSIAVTGILLMVWELLHFGIGTPSFLEFARGFAEIVFIIAVVCLPPSRKQSISELTRVLALSSAVAFIILLFATVEGRGASIMELMEKGFRFGVSEITEELFVFNYNANGLGFICNLAIVGLLINVYNKNAKIIDYLMIVFLVFIGLLTVSRTFLLCLAIMVILYILLQKRSLLQRALTVLILGTVAIIMLLLISEYFPSIIDNYDNRFSVDDVTGNRAYLLSFYNEFIFSSSENLFFGIGIQDISEKAYSITGIDPGVPHNGYQQLIVAWGIPGFVLMLLFVCKIISQARKFNKKIPLMYYLPLLLLLIDNLAGQFVTAPSNMLSLVFIFEILSNINSYNEDKKWKMNK